MLMAGFVCTIINKQNNVIMCNGVMLVLEDEQGIQQAIKTSYGQQPVLPKNWIFYLVVKYTIVN